MADTAQTPEWSGPAACQTINLPRASWDAQALSWTRLPSHRPWPSCTRDTTGWGERPHVDATGKLLETVARVR